MRAADVSLKLTRDLVSAYVVRNAVPLGELERLLRAVHHSLSQIIAGEPMMRPAVPVTASITPDYLICLEDGKRLKMLRRYLRSQYGMSPEAYRAKWQLPADYPMTAPNYAARRSSLAKTFGLGRARNAPGRRTPRG